MNEPRSGIVVTIHEFWDNKERGQTLDEVADNLRRLGATRIFVDSGGPGTSILDHLKRVHRLPVEALPRLGAEEVWDLQTRLANCRALLGRAEHLLKAAGESALPPVQKDLLFDIEAMKGRC